jgi:ABC-2 type transport system ATP-binding protein
MELMNASASTNRQTLPGPGSGLVAWGLHKAHGGRNAVSGVALSALPGTCLGVLGPNGAGKSTTLGMLAGVLKPDAGRITYGGETDPTRRPVRQRLGFVPQSLALYQDLTAAENLRLFARLYGVPARRVAERVEWALALAGLSDQRARRVRTFSGGMQRRLNLSCATLHEPKFLLLDEPTVGVDPQSREHIFRTIEQLKGAGLTIVYSTHYMEEAERLCDRIAILDRGSVIAEGTKDELLARHGGALRVDAEFAPAGDLRIASGAPEWLYASESGSRKLSFECERAGEVLPRLLEHGEALRHLTVRRPTLETVFLALTGRSLRD